MMFSMTMLSTDELAQLAGVSAATVRRYARSGDLPAVASPGGHRKFDQREALAALEVLRERIRQAPADEDALFSGFDPPATPRGPATTVVPSVRRVSPTGSTKHMVRQKATITLDRATVAEVQRLTGAATTSAAVGLALRALIKAERIRHDVAAYQLMPITDEELALTNLRPDWSDLADDTDWDAMFPEET
jgi:excisionase family DNA binding protein